MPFYILSLDGSSDRTYIRSPKISNSKSMGIIERALIRSRKRQFVNNRTTTHILHKNRSIGIPLG
ncbi:hypothetical protein OUZ56_017756 [Daphnia magna]|uniref:Uncharacterized protein n=1 Tax=Daphnia magna TaxID=35525 RepID=A0ABR0ATP4_9CRUS|nr:hypothetical protein OUZ56_017756 [Daphnia magna]